MGGDCRNPTVLSVFNQALVLEGGTCRFTLGPEFIKRNGLGKKEELDKTDTVLVLNKIA